MHISRIALLALLILTGCGGGIEESGRKGALRDYVLMTLAQPQFAGEAFERQILGDVSLELYDLDSNLVYFSYPGQEIGRGELGGIAGKFVIDTARVELAREVDGIFHLGDYQLRKSQKNGCFFRTSVENIAIDSAAILKFGFHRGVYTLSMAELVDFIRNRSVHGGPVETYTEERRNGRYVMFANHGAFVAKGGEGSLTRFAAELTKDIPATDPMAREKKIQALLDLVTMEIAYDVSEASENVETLKRANEVLMTMRSDCSNKTILFASLLEQIGEDYLLVYMPHHIAVAVKQGKFPNGNNLSFTWDGETWLIAETTAEGFRIGTDQLKQSFSFQDVRYVQRPREQDVIISPHTGKELVFR
jgi:hypothetical protein